MQARSVLLGRLHTDLLQLLLKFFPMSNITGQDDITQQRNNFV